MRHKVTVGSTVSLGFAHGSDRAQALARLKTECSRVSVCALSRTLIQLDLDALRGALTAVRFRHPVAGVAIDPVPGAGGEGDFVLAAVQYGINR